MANDFFVCINSNAFKSRINYNSNHYPGDSDLAENQSESFDS